MTKGELDLYLKHLEAFGKHYQSCPNSLLAKVFGCFTVSTDYMEDIHIMLMENTVQLSDPENLKHIFDLKGSLVDRYVKGETKASTTLKDQNFLNIKKLQ